MDIDESGQATALTAHLCVKWSARQLWGAWMTLLQLMAAAACNKGIACRQIKLKCILLRMPAAGNSFVLPTHLDSCRTKDDCLFMVFVDALSNNARSDVTLGAAFAGCLA